MENKTLSSDEEQGSEHYISRDKKIEWKKNVPKFSVEKKKTSHYTKSST
jgi:hypothetical protein